MKTPMEEAETIVETVATAEVVAVVVVELAVAEKSSEVEKRIVVWLVVDVVVVMWKIGTLFDPRRIDAAAVVDVVAAAGAVAGFAELEHGRSSAFATPLVASSPMFVRSVERQRWMIVSSSTDVPTLFHDPWIAYWLFSSYHKNYFYAEVLCKLDKKILFPSC